MTIIPAFLFLAGIGQTGRRNLSAPLWVAAKRGGEGDFPDFVAAATMPGALTWT